MKERRNRHRICFPTEVILQLDNAPPMTGEISNLSMSGAQVVIDKPPPEGSQGVMTIPLDCGDEHREIKAKFEVVRHDSHQNIAIKQACLTPDDSILLYQCIRAQG